MLVDDRGSIAIELPLKSRAAIREGAAAEVRAAVNDDPRGLTLGVRIDDACAAPEFGEDSRRHQHGQRDGHQGVGISDVAKWTHPKSDEQNGRCDRNNGGHGKIPP